MTVALISVSCHMTLFPISIRIMRITLTHHNIIGISSDFSTHKRIPRKLVNVLFTRRYSRNRLFRFVWKYQYYYL